jgi:hypothetical protein
VDLRPPLGSHCGNYGSLGFDSFVDSFAWRLREASGDALRRLRHNPNTGETPRHVVRCSETICRESLNPKVQGSIPCASTNMLCLRRPTIYMLWSVYRDASYLRHLTASFDSFGNYSGTLGVGARLRTVQLAQTE